MPRKFNVKKAVQRLAHQLVVDAMADTQWSEYFKYWDYLGKLDKFQLEEFVRELILRGLVSELDKTYSRAELLFLIEESGKRVKRLYGHLLSVNPKAKYRDIELYRRNFSLSIYKYQQRKRRNEQEKKKTQS